MKKSIFLLIFAALVSAASFALEVKLGAGAILNADFGGGFKSERMGLTDSMSFTEVGGGAFLSFDLSCLELVLSYTGGLTIPQVKALGLSVKTDPGTYAALGAGVLGKIPLRASPRLTLFPLLGVNYQRILSYKNDKGEEYKNIKGKETPNEFSALWIQFGGGGDFNLTNHLFLRGELLYGVRLNNQFEKDTVDNTPGAKAYPGHGPSLKAGIGYRF